MSDVPSDKVILTRRHLLGVTGALVSTGSDSLAQPAPTVRRLGPVATRAKTHNHFFPHTRSMSRTYHFARDNLLEVQVVFANWYSQPGDEFETGAPAIVKASIEYPTGVFTPMQFSGNPVGTVPDGGMLMSDPVRTRISKDAKFFVRTLWEHRDKVVLSGRQDRPRGDAWASGGAEIADRTLGGVIEPTNNDVCHFPVAILAHTLAKSVYILGDSRAREEGDRIDDGAGDQGNIARSIGPAFGYINGAIPGETFESFLAANAQRRILAEYATHIVGELGIVDLTGGATAEILKPYVYAVADLFPGKPLFWATAEPVTTSTDKWQTLEKQTPHPCHAERLLWNNWIRSGTTALLAGHFDLADTAESARDSGLFKAPIPGGFPVMTEDGTHLSHAGNLHQKNAGAVLTRRILGALELPKVRAGTPPVKGVAQ